VLSSAELARLVQLPDRARQQAGPVAIVECVEEIPCNPCAFACPRKAITISGALTDRPRIDFAKCNGCTMCVARCPGLAIFVVNCAFSKTEASVALPWELLPRPQPGERVGLADRAGRRVGTGKVLKVLDTRAQDRCAVVTVAVPKHLWNTVRHLQLPHRKERAE
jgi:Fe-S-cluster-containing hydrogenase component 2